jgi:tetratricopeptide (TPR) repeat protein
VLLARAVQAYAVAVYRLQLRASQALLAGARLAASLPRVELRPDGGIREAHRLNNLAIALAQAGAEAEALEHLEQARVVLRELGDEEHEAQVIANLGMVHRRQGHSEEAVHLLHEALDKLPPESSAYRRVEEELRTAS